MALNVVPPAWPLSCGDHTVGARGAGTCGPSCSSGQVLFCQFLWNAKGFFVLFCFFVKLKKIYILYLSFHT